MSQSTKQARPRVLVCEQREAVARRIGYCLNRAGVLHDWAYNGKRARQWLSARRRLQRGTYDVVLTNLLLEDQDGVSLMLELRNSGLKVPMFAISGRHGHAMDGRNRGSGRPAWLEPAIGYSRALFALKLAARKAARADLDLLHLEPDASLQELVANTLSREFHLECISKLAQAIQALHSNPTQIVLANPSLMDVAGKPMVYTLMENCPALPFVLPGSMEFEGDGYDEDLQSEGEPAKGLIALVASCASRQRGIDTCLDELA